MFTKPRVGKLGERVLPPERAGGKWPAAAGGGGGAAAKGCGWKGAWIAAVWGVWGVWQVWQVGSRKQGGGGGARGVRYGAWGVRTWDRSVGVGWRRRRCMVLA